MKVFVVMLNDYPTSVHATEESAERGMVYSIERAGGVVPPPRSGEESPRMSIAGKREGIPCLFARVYEFDVCDVPRPEEKS